MSHQITADMTATVWKVLVAPGESVEAGTELLLLESMKMEIPVESDVRGVVGELLVAEGDSVREGQALVTIQPS